MGTSRDRSPTTSARQLRGPLLALIACAMVSGLMASCSVSPRPDAAWQQLYPRDSPPSHLPLGMVYDPATSQMLLLVTGSYGEVGLTPASLLAHTWLWEKGTWTAKAAMRTETSGWFPGAQKGSGPSLLAGGSADLVYDAATRSVILYNGFMTGPWVPGGPILNTTEICSTIFIAMRRPLK